MLFDAVRARLRISVGVGDEGEHFDDPGDLERLGRLNPKRRRICAAAHRVSEMYRREGAFETAAPDDSSNHEGCGRVR